MVHQNIRPDFPGAMLLRSRIPRPHCICFLSKQIKFWIKNWVILGPYYTQSFTPYTVLLKTYFEFNFALSKTCFEFLPLCCCWILTLNLYPHSVLLLSEWNRKWRWGPLKLTCLGHLVVPTFWSNLIWTPLASLKAR